MKVILKKVRVMYPRLFQPVEFQKSPEESDPAKAKYSAILLIDPSTGEGKKNLVTLKKAIQTVAGEKWKTTKVPKSLTSCLSDGNNKDNEAYTDQWVVSASDRFAPLVVDRSNKVVPISGASLFKDGAEVNAIITLWAQDNSYGKKVNANLKGVQYVSEGIPVRNDSSVADDFDELEIIPGDEEEEIAF